MLFLLKLFKKEPKEIKKSNEAKKTDIKKDNKSIRKGELGEYKIDIQLSQLPKDYRYTSDLLIKNPRAKSGYSQVDHAVITPYGIFVIETKNYQGTIYGGKERKQWSANGRFNFMNPFIQNYGHIEALKSLIDRKFHNTIISMVSFTKRCTFKLDELDYRKIQSDHLMVYDVELSDFILRKVSVLKLIHKEPLLSKADIDDIHSALISANIVDESIRLRHVQALRNESKGENTKYKCTICQKPVSAKVSAFCLSNKKFKGKVYCFEHQKGI